MVRKISACFLGLFIFVACFTASLPLHSYFYTKTLRNNLQKVKAGMSTDEAVKILGNPSQIEDSDIPGEYWCYETDYLSKILEDQPEQRCAAILIETDGNGKVAKVFDFQSR